MDGTEGFDAVFADPDRFVAVLDVDGTVRRANAAALRFLDRPADAVEGKRIWGLPIAERGGSSRAIQRAVGDAADGDYAEFEAAIVGQDDEPAFAFRIRPVGGGSGAVRSLLVEGRQLAERAELEAELRESEELHRVTLNNMTDTVLVTDESGAFTYVCPNVHFIFGYTAEEFHAFGTIDAILDEDPVDGETLDDRRIVSNVECTATDKDGDEHTLLVTVRRVSIQGGTRLYSCRDITARKQRERALSRLHDTSRALLYAETAPAILDRVVDDARAVLEDGMVAVYRFDRDENRLSPARVSPALERDVGSVPDVGLTRDTPVGAAFVGEETVHRVALDDATATDDGSSDWFSSTLSDAIAVPLGDHGVLLATTTDGSAFAGIGVEIAELVAATAEAALDRVERERELRERDEELERRNRRLTEANRVNEIIREIDGALVDAGTRAEIEEAVCERLAADGRFRFAWIGETASGGSIEPRTWAGDGQGYLDDVRFDALADGVVEPTVRTVETREPTHVANTADRLRDADWCREAVSRDFHSVLAVPLVYDDVLLGTLSVYADRPDAFGETIRTVFGELGDTIAAAINATQRKEALASDTVVELAYRADGSASVLSRLAASEDCTIEVEAAIPTGDATLVLARVAGATPGSVVAAAASLVDVADAEAIGGTDDGGLVAVELDGGFVGTSLADHGAVDTSVRATPDDLRVTVVVPDVVATRKIDEVVSNTLHGAELVSRRERTKEVDVTDRRDEFDASLTDRQREVLRAAYHSGYFDTDRDVTGRDVASMLGISHTAFYDHVRRVQGKLFATLFEDG